MSYILDALKKSDADRASRQQIPTAINQPIDRQHSSWRSWMPLSVLLLLVLAVLLWGIFKPTEQHHVETSSNVVVQQQQTEASVQQQPVVTTYAESTIDTPPQQPSTTPPHDTVTTIVAIPVQPKAMTEAEMPIESVATQPLQTTTELRTSIDKPIQQPQEFAKLPTQIRQSLAWLHLEGHFYDAEKQSGMVIIKGQIYHHGDWVDDTLYLESITVDGAIFEYEQKHRFHLNRLQ